MQNVLVPPTLTNDADDDKKKHYDKEMTKASLALSAVLQTLDQSKD